jgi:hypothetical protein
MPNGKKLGNFTKADYLKLGSMSDAELANAITKDPAAAVRSKR